MDNFHESDWKKLRALKPILLDRFCQRVFRRVRELAGEELAGSHQRYLEMFRYTSEQDKDLADAFNDLRRSNAVWKLATMRRLGLITDEEFGTFSEDARRSVDNLQGYFASRTSSE